MDVSVPKMETKVKSPTALPEPTVEAKPKSPSDKLLNKLNVPQSPVDNVVKPSTAFKEIKTDAPSSSFKEIKLDEIEKPESPINYPKMDTLDTPAP